jgi:hypothetical protein
VSGDNVYDLIPAPDQVRDTIERGLAKLEADGPFGIADGLELALACGAMGTADPPLTPLERLRIQQRVDAAKRALDARKQLRDGG